MREPYSLDVFRWKGELLVSPAVGSSLGFKNLSGVIAVPSREELLPALEEARARVEAAWARPKAERFPDGPAYYVAAGAASWSEFVRDAISVSISYRRNDTEISVLVPDAGFKRLEATAVWPSRKYPIDLPLADAASAVSKLLDEIPA